jgi:hypothetical protein
VRNQTVIREATLALLEARGEDPEGVWTRFDSRGRRTDITFYDRAENDVQTVLDTAVPGFLDGSVMVVARDYCGD